MKHPLPTTPANGVASGTSRAARADLPRGWNRVTLHDLLEEVDVRARDMRSAEGEEIPVFSLTKRFGLIPQSERFEHRVATEDTSKYKVVRAGHIAYNPYVIWEGAVHALRNADVALVSPVYVVWETRESDGGYVDHLLRTPEVMDAYNRLSSGAVNRRRSIQKDGFLSIEVSIPPLEERRAISAALACAIRSVAASSTTVGAVRDLRASLRRHLFTYGAVRLDEVDQVVTKDTGIGQMPEGWTIGPLSDYTALVQYGLSLRGSETGPHLMLRMNSLQDGRILTTGAPGGVQFVDLDRDQLAKFRLETGDILFNRTNSLALVGKTALFEGDEDTVFASYLVRVRTDRTRLDPHYVNHYLNDAATQSRLKRLASRGVSQSNINASKLRALEIPVPPMAEQLEIVSHLQGVDALLRAEEARMAAAQSALDSLLRSLTTGSVRLPEFGPST